jgi:hypothetical protein
MPSLSRHKSRCKVLLENKTEQTKEAEFQKIIFEKDEEMKKKDEEIKYFKAVAEKAGIIAEQNSKTAAKSVNALTFLMKNYTNAPALTQVPEIRYAEIADKKFGLCETVIHYYKEKRLSSYLGDCIVMFYKKDNPHDNSFWTSDLTRTTFYYRNEELIWVIDKIAQRVGKKIIDPMLDYIRKKLVVYNEKENALSKKRNQSTLEMGLHVKNNTYGMDVIRLVEKGILKKNITKYISQYFHLDRELKQIEYTDENKENPVNNNKNDKNNEKINDIGLEDVISENDEDEQKDVISESDLEIEVDIIDDIMDDNFDKKLDYSENSTEEADYDKLNEDWIKEQKKKYGQKI